MVVGRLAPIVITVYDRLSHLQNCIESLKANELARASELYVFSDAPVLQAHAARIEALREYIGQIEGFRRVVPIFREKNMGAYGSTLGAYTYILDISDSFIFLEDDIVVSKHFLRYMNDGLRFYRDDPRILSICSYNLPMRMPALYRKSIYLGKRFSPWGFGMWRDRWEAMDLSPRDRYSMATSDGELLRCIDSVGGDYRGLLEMDSKGAIEAIDVRICYHQLINDMYCVFPTRSLSNNTGFDGSGMHCGSSSRFNASLDDRDEFHIRLDKGLKPDPRILRRFKDFQDGRDRGFLAAIHFVRRKARSLPRRIGSLWGIGSR